MAKDIKGRQLPKGIIQLKSGLYRGQIQLNGEKINLSSHDLTELKTALAQKRLLIINGEYHKEKNITVKDWFETWLTVYKTDLKESTISTYRQVFKNCIAAEIGNKKINAVKAETLQKLINELVQNGISYKRASLVYIVLNGIFTHAKRLHYINVNPMAEKAVILPPKKRFKDREYKQGKRLIFMDPKQKDLFIEYSKGSVYQDIYIFMLNTGTRLGEATGLQWSDVDFQKKEIHISHTLNYIRGRGRILDTTKSESSNRVLPMSNKVFELLKRIRLEQIENRSALGSSWKEEPHLCNMVFTQPTGGAFWESDIRVDMNHISEKIVKDGHDFQRISPHTFRHTFATLGLKNGIPPKVMQKLLGHASIRITLDIYASVLKEDLTESMNLIEAVM